MSFRIIWGASSAVGAVTYVNLVQKNSSSPAAALHLKVLARDEYGASEIHVDLRFTSGTYTRRNPPNISSNGITVVTCRSVYPDYLTDLALLISSDAYEIQAVGGGSISGITIQPSMGCYSHTGLCGVNVAPPPPPPIS